MGRAQKSFDFLFHTVYFHLFLGGWGQGGDGVVVGGWWSGGDLPLISQSPSWDEQKLQRGRGRSSHGGGACVSPPRLLLLQSGVRLPLLSALFSGIAVLRLAVAQNEELSVSGCWAGPAGGRDQAALLF